MAPRRSLLAGFAAVAALVAPPSAHADFAITELADRTPISAYGGTLAWSAYDETTERYALVIRQGDVIAPASTPPARRPFDVSLGPDSAGHVVALYTRCTATGGCDIYRYDLRRRRESRLGSVSSPTLDEAAPAQWRDRIAFVRRARTHVTEEPFRPDPSGKGPLMECDIPYVKTLSSRAPSRRLDRSECGATTGMAIRRDTIALVTDIGEETNSESQVRTIGVHGGAATILARTAGGMGGGYSPFTAPSLSETAVWLTRYGERDGEPRGFLRIDRRSRKLTTIPADDIVTIARDERGRFWYVQGVRPDARGVYGCGVARDPCRLVQASASPFSATPRTLLPRLNIDGDEGVAIGVLAAGPAVVTGDVSRAIVRRGAIVGRRPVPGVALELLRSDQLLSELLYVSREDPDPFAATGQTTTTDPAGRWSLTLDQPPPQFVLLVVAPGPRIASKIMGVDAGASITLTAGGRNLTGTVAPVQPGRNIEIQRLAADSRGRLPDGREVCSSLMIPESCVDDAWSTVLHAPLPAPGGAFSATVAGPGLYRARLPVEYVGGRPAGYYGVSPAIRIAT